MGLGIDEAWRHRQSSSVDHPLGSRLRLPGQQMQLALPAAHTALIGRFPSAVHDRRIPYQ